MEFLVLHALITFVNADIQPIFDRNKFLNFWEMSLFLAHFWAFLLIFSESVEQKHDTGSLKKKHPLGKWYKIDLELSIWDNETSMDA